MGEPTAQDALRVAQLEFERFLRARRLKVTSERRDVLAAVFGSQDHFDAKGIVRRLRGRGCRVSRATTYRALDLLVEAGIIMRHDFGDGEAHYELRHGRARHDHFHCVRCHRIIEFENEGVQALVQRIGEDYRFATETHRLHVYGLCSRCREEGDAPERPESA
jgi:Fur family ferric uptake transcriptional regulator